MIESLSPNFVPGDGPRPCQVMIIGEAPGAEEDMLGKPFVGRAGKLLTEALDEANLPRASVYITNIVKQRPPNNRTPYPHEIKASLPYLLDELIEVKPRFVLLLGNTALSTSTIWEGGITKRRGKIKEDDHVFPHPSMVWATLHPSAALRSRDNKLTFFADIQTFAKITRSVYTPSGQGDE